MNKYRNVIEQEAMKYYETTSKLIEAKLDQKPSCLFIMDFIKNMLERG